MNRGKKRIYTSEARDAQAVQTRKRILDAAKELFQTEGFDRVTIGKLAKAAAVSMPTIYALFKSKRGILQCLIDEALPPNQFSALAEEAKQEKSPKIYLSISAKMARQIYDAERELMDILRSASVVAPELRELEQEREKRRYERQGEGVKMLLKEKALAKGLSLATARDILWSLTGRDMYRMLVVERGWTPEEYEKWLAQQLINALLEPNS